MAKKMCIRDSINFITWLKAFGVGFSYHIRSLFTPMRASALLYHFVRQA